MEEMICFSVYSQVFTVRIWFSLLFPSFFVLFSLFFVLFPSFFVLFSFFVIFRIVFVLFSLIVFHFKTAFLIVSGKLSFLEALYHSCSASRSEVLDPTFVQKLYFVDMLSFTNAVYFKVQFQYFV